MVLRVVRNVRLNHELFAFLDQLLEVRPVALRWVQLADKAFVDSLVLHVLLFSITVFVAHIVDELKRVKQYVFLALVELPIGGLEDL